MKKLIQKWNSINLIKRIICGLIVGIILGLAIPQASVISILGDLFVGALRGISPLLVFFLVMSSLCHMGKGQKTNMKFVVVLYLLGNILSALAAVISSRLFPIMLTFSENTNTSDVTPPSGVAEVLKNLLMNIVSNPVDALVNANYIGILAWAIIFGIALKAASETTKTVIENISDATSTAKMDHQPCSIWYHGPDLHNHLRAGAWRTVKLWPSDLYTGGNHALCCTGDQPDHYFHLHTPESVSAGSALPEGQWYHSILHKKLCRQHSGKHGAVQGSRT